MKDENSIALEKLELEIISGGDNSSDGEEFSQNSDSEEVLELGQVDAPAIDQNKSSKKKKKKKKNKSNPKNVTVQVKAIDMLPSDVADTKYTSAIESLRSGDDSCLWVELAKCRIGDKKAKKIADALEANKTVISLDLSSNVISDEGVQQLVKSISSGAAPDLIELNLEGNNITEKGKTALESLKKTRKLLKIDLLESQNGDFLKSPGNWTQNDVFEELPRGLIISGANGQKVDPSDQEKLQPVEIMEKVIRAVRESQLKLNPLAILNSYSDLMTLIIRELKESPHKTYSAFKISALPPGLRLTCQNLPELLSVLHLDPEPHPRQYCQLSPCAGLHRVAAVELTQRLLISCNKCVESEVAAFKGVGTILVDFLFRFPDNSRLHSALSRLFRTAISRPVSPVASSILDGESGLIERLAKEGSASCQVPIGKRKGYVGHVIMLSKLLNSMCTKHRALKKKLDGSTQWQSYIADGGPLSSFEKEHRGCLGGERPPESRGNLGGFGMVEEEPTEAQQVETLLNQYLERSLGGFKSLR